MSILQELENLKYRSVLDLIKNNEQYNKKNEVFSAKDVFKMCYERYQLMQQVLLPLKEKLGDQIDVTDISFANGMQDDMNILVRYTKGEKQYLLAISNQFPDIEVVSSDIVAQNESFVKANRGIIFKTFRNINENNLANEVVIKSTTGKFILKDNCDSFTIQDNEEKIFTLSNKYSSYEKNKSLFPTSKLECNFPKLKELLGKEENAIAIYDHLKVYENKIPGDLIKKLTYR